MSVWILLSRPEFKRLPFQKLCKPTTENIVFQYAENILYSMSVSQSLLASNRSIFFAIAIACLSVSFDSVLGLCTITSC